MSVYQAIRQYATDTPQNPPATSDPHADTSPLPTTSIWSQIHTIHYRLVPTKPPTPAKHTTPSTSDTKRITRASQSNLHSPSQAPSQKPTRKDPDTPANNTDLLKSLTASWQTASSISQDPSVNSITLLRLLDTLNRHWHLMYVQTHSQASLWPPCDTASQAPLFLLGAEQFVNAKLTAKANRQLQDPLAIMTGHLPKWLPELVAACPFLFPFKTRLMYFYVQSLDRDRAMQKLIESNADALSAAGESLDRSERHSDRFVPKLEKKKRTVSRQGDLIKQTDAVLAEFCEATHKPALLEIQYEGEVGTGLGPTLEFYALVSREVQRCELEMWRGDKHGVVGVN
jgi:E3 ubiquitin-protein ligase TRIP12